MSKSKWRPPTTELILAVLLQISAARRINAQEDALVAADTTTLSVVFASSAAWSHQRTALLFRLGDGDIASEIPLTQSEDTSSGKAIIRQVTGGVSDNGRFAYSFDKTVTWNASKSKVLKSQTFLRVYGTDSKPLWETNEADAPEGQEPLHFSADGETFIVLERKEKGWIASVRYYLGAKIIEAGPLARVETATLTKNGAYAMVKWIVPDQSATHTFLDIKKQSRKDIASGDLYLGSARITDDGKVFSNKKLVFDFNAPAKP